MFWKKTKTFNDQEIIQGFRAMDPHVVNYVYSAYYKVVETFIVNHGGSYEDVKDVYQEALSAIFLKIQKEEFILNSAFGTFLFSICKNLWMGELRKRKYSKELMNQIGQDSTEEDTDSLVMEFLQERKEYLFRKHYATLDEECQHVIRLYLKKISFKEIAAIMGFPSELHAIKRKSRCKEMLIRRVKNDPEFDELY
ncbi:MAG: RNA polymerase sigma factor [Bacteroidales bacterium]